LDKTDRKTNQSSSFSAWDLFGTSRMQSASCPIVAQLSVIYGFYATLMDEQIIREFVALVAELAYTCLRMPTQTRPDQTRGNETRPDQTRQDKTRPDQTRPNEIRPVVGRTEQITRKMTNRNPVSVAIFTLQVLHNISSYEIFISK
jgi:hypothetical protein